MEFILALILFLVVILGIISIDHRLKIIVKIYPSMKWICAFLGLAALFGPQPAAAVLIYSRISVTFDPSLGLTATQQDDLKSSVAANMESRIAVTEGWQCIQPPSVAAPDVKNEGIPSQQGKQIYEVIKLEVSVLGGSISTRLGRQTAVASYTVLASYNLPLDVLGGRGAALEGKLADLMAHAVDSTLSQAHPCGRWTGTIEFREEENNENHSEMSDLTNHRLVDITITQNNQGIATAHTHAEQRANSEGRRRVFSNGAVSIVKDSWQTTTVKGDDDSSASINVVVDDMHLNFTVFVNFSPITAHKHVEGCSRNAPLPCLPSDQDFLVTFGWPTTIGGQLEDPKHLQGKVPLMDNGTTTAFQKYDLQWEP
jgi:hypothetical protein